MGGEYKLVGIGGNIPVSEHVEGDLYHVCMKFIEYVKDESGSICGAKLGLMRAMDMVSITEKKPYCTQMKNFNLCIIIPIQATEPGMTIFSR